MPDKQDNRQPRKMRGLYGKVNISVSTLNKVIVGGILAMVLILAYGIRHSGYKVEFDTLGGTPVESQVKMYGDLVDEPEEPTREGYTFAGWYLDENCTREWIMEESLVSEPMTLYARWEKAQ